MTSITNTVYAMLSVKHNYSTDYPNNVNWNDPYHLTAIHNTQSVIMTESLWNNTQVTEEYPRLVTSVIPGSTRLAG